MQTNNQNTNDAVDLGVGPKKLLNRHEGNFNLSIQGACGAEGRCSNAAIAYLDLTSDCLAFSSSC